MTIEVTGEARLAAYFAARKWATDHRHDQPDDRMLDAAIDTALAIVERANADQVQREWDALEYCPSIDPDHPGWHCEMQLGHDGNHRAMRWSLEWAS